MMKKKAISLAKQTWKFLWEDDSIWSWIVNIALAFILIKFIIFPVLGLILGTGYPIVAVVSGSMEHGGSFDEWWQGQETRYQQFNITRGEFEKYPLKDGFNVGDIIVLRGARKENLKVGDIVVFRAQDNNKRPDPIIHRVILINSAGNNFQTKGDHNLLQITSPDLDETKISWDNVLGKAWIRIPYLGYVKIWFVNLIKLVRG